MAMEIYLCVGRHGQGYGWVFPKRNEASIGVGCRLSDAAGLCTDWRDFVSQLERSKACELDISRKTAAMVPLGPSQKRFVARRTMLVGDAAGLASPVSGEGIYYALMSGLFAAEAAIECVQQRDPRRILGYEENLRKSLIGELKMASRVGRVVVRSRSSLETVFELAADDEIMRSLMVDFVVGTRDCSQTTMKLVTRLLTHHPAEALQLGLK
jgi:flavin-dependent dehydrogenase